MFGRTTEHRPSSAVAFGKTADGRRPTEEEHPLVVLHVGRDPEIAEPSAASSRNQLSVAHRMLQLQQHQLVVQICDLHRLSLRPQNGGHRPEDSRL